MNFFKTRAEINFNGNTSARSIIPLMNVISTLSKRNAITNNACIGPISNI
jgi:hypothetical protein